MSSNFGRISRYLVAGVTLVGLGSLSACLSDDNDDKDDSAAGASTSGGSSAGTSAQTGGSTSSAGTSSAGGTGSVGKTCRKLAATATGIASFDDYDGSADLGKWSFPLGGDSASGALGGTFGYGDRASGMPETFGMVEGHESMYALSIADTEAKEYGGGMGIWLSDCLDASAFTGVSFWVKGNAPTKDAKLSLLTPETTSKEIKDSKGTCAGTEKECLSPNVMFTVTDTWTEVKVAWADLTPGSNLGEPVVADGKRLSQIQFDVALAWKADADGVYHPTPAPYELVVDGLSFY